MRDARVKSVFPAGILLALGLGVSAAPTAAALQAPAGGGVLSGRVLWNGRGVEGIIVRLCGVEWRIKGGRKVFQVGRPIYDGCKTDRTATTDIEGAYSFDNLEAGEYVVMAHQGDTWTFMSLPRRSVDLAIGRSWINVTPYSVSASKKAVADSISLIHELELESPVRGAAVEQPRPILRWKAVEGVTQYKVSLATGQFLKRAGAPVSNAPPFLGAKILLERPTTKVEMIAPRSLGNCNYFWWVEAFNASGTKIAESWNYYQTTQKAPEEIGHFTVVAQPKAESVACQ
jgi:hypothetical protein